MYVGHLRVGCMGKHTWAMGSKKGAWRLKKAILVKFTFEERREDTPHPPKKNSVPPDKIPLSSPSLEVYLKT